MSRIRKQRKSIEILKINPFVRISAIHQKLHKINFLNQNFLIVHYISENSQ